MPDQVDDDTAAASRRCQVVEVDGEPVRVQAAGDWTDKDCSVLAEVVRAAKAKMATEVRTPLTVNCPMCGAQAGMLCRREDNGKFGRSPHPERRKAVAP